MKKEKSGYITVYLALLLGVLLSFVFTILEAVRVQTIRTQTEGTMDVGLFSIFGEFHRELLEQYDIFAIDTTYGEGKPDICKSEEHLQYYLNQNFENDKKNSFYNFRDLTNLHCDNVDFEAYMRTSDEEGQVLKRQIVEYMQEKKGIAWVETGVEHLLKLQEQGKLSRDVEREWNSANETVHSMVEERKKEFIDEETGSEVTVTEYVVSDLEADGITLSTPLFAEVIQELKQHIGTPGFTAERYFVGHANPTLSRLAADLVEEKYQLSKYHSKTQSVVKEADRLHEIMPHLLGDYKMAIVDIELKETQNQLRQPTVMNDPALCMETMARYKQLMETRKVMAKILGDRVIGT